jgi:membrane protease YdiL (CAAX protease family)
MAKITPATLPSNPLPADRSATAVPAPARDSVGKARRGLAIYLAGVIVGSAVVEGAMLRSGLPIGAQGPLVALLMWVPALASILPRLVLREGFHDVSLRLGGRSGLRSLALGWGFPVVVSLVAYGVAWGLGLATIAPPATDYFARVPSLAIKLVLSLVLGLTVLTAAGMLTAAGEEIGWRGYLLTRLIEARLPRPVLLSGLIWAGWHLPLILSGQYAAGLSPALSAALFVITVVPFAYLQAYLRLTSGSIWPTIVAHGAWNAVLVNTFGAFTSGAFAGLWTGESGLLTALATIVVVALVVGGTWSMRKAPADAPFAEARATSI